MSTGAIIMMVFGLLVTWGGAAVCIAIALKKKTHKGEDYNIHTP